MDELQPAEFEPYRLMQLLPRDEAQDIQFQRVMYDNIDVDQHYFVSIRDPEWAMKDYFVRVVGKDANNSIVRFKSIMERFIDEDDMRGAFFEAAWPDEEILASRAWIDAPYDADVKYFFWVRRVAAGGARRTLRRRRHRSRRSARLSERNGAETHGAERRECRRSLRRRR